MYKFLKHSQLLFHPFKPFFIVIILNVLISLTSSYELVDKRINNKTITSDDEISVLFNRRDYRIAEKFSRSLKHFKGNWASHGIQRIIRLNSDCSNRYVSLRNFRIRADIPSNEAFTDPYTLIEQQVYRNTMALKSKQTNKYVCYNANTGNFILKSIHELDRYCVFFYSIQKQNQYTFTIGSNKAIYLSFNRIGRSISARFLTRKFPSCPENTNLFNVITKATDYVKASKPPIVIVYEAKKPIKSYSLKSGYQSIFYSTLEHNYVTRTFPFESTTIPTTTTTTTTETTTLASTIRNYNVYEFLSRADFNQSMMNKVESHGRENLYRKGLLGRKLRRNRMMRWRRRRRRKNFFRTSTSHPVN